jgi:hypothetical protein
MAKESFERSRSALLLPPPRVECPGQRDCRNPRDEGADDPRRDTFEDDAFGDQPPADQAADPGHAHAQRNQGDEGSHPALGRLGSIPSPLSHAISPPAG